MLSLKPSLSIRCDGELLSSQVSWGDLAYAHGWPNGCTDASFRITRRSQQRPRMLRRGAFMEVSWGGWPVWAGTLAKPDWNGREAEIKALGLFKLGDQFMAFTAAGETTANPTTAIAAAQDRGLPWRIGPGIPDDVIGPGTTDPVNSILDLLEAWAEKSGQRWGVDARRYAFMAADPVTPYYRVPAGVVDLGQDSSTYRSRIVLRYEHTSGIYKTVWWPGLTLPSTGDFTRAEELWDYAEWVRDATGLGPMSDAAAQDLAHQVFDLTGGRPGWANGLTLPYGYLLTRGGEPVHPASVREGRMVRLDGVPDELNGTNYTDIVIGATSYTHGDRSVGIDPVGLVVNSPEAAWTALFEAVG